LHFGLSGLRSIHRTEARNPCRNAGIHSRGERSSGGNPCRLTAIGPYGILPRIFFGLAACSVAVNAAGGFAKLWGAVNDGGTANPS
jgi:hypothetical protein